MSSDIYRIYTFCNFHKKKKKKPLVPITISELLIIRATGVVTVKIGKIAACAIGGSIIIMQIAAHQGYIKVNWDKVMTKAEKISDKVEEKITGEGPNLMDKVGAKVSSL